MKYTIQRFSNCGNWANPEPTSVVYAATKQEVNDLFADWYELVGRFSDERNAYLRVWCNDLDDVTDEYPDFELTLGPRLGIRWNPC